MENNKLVEIAKKKGKKVQEVEILLENAKLSYHRSIKDLHENGMSYRKIAQDLALSHQRVHQIVSIQPDLPEESNKVTHCSFCKATESKKNKLVKSKNVFICSSCLSHSSKALQQSKSKSKKHKYKKLGKDTNAKCLFCSHFATKKRDLVQFKKNQICSHCITQLAQNS